MNLPRILPSLVNLIIIAVSIIFTILLIEGSTRVYLFFSPISKPITAAQFRKSIPKPYKQSDFNVIEMVDEAFGKVSWFTPPQTRLVYPKDLSGKYITISKHIRVTSDQPAIPRNSIYIFGGSTVFCGEVPDRYTLSSFLQRDVNLKFPGVYKVENYGSTSVISTQELERLKTIQLKKGDIVIFYDGANDVFQSIYNGDPSGWIVGKNRAIVSEKGLLLKYFIMFYDNFSSHSEFIKLFLSPYEYSHEPKHFQNPDEIKRLQEEMRSLYINNVAESNELVKKSGAIFFHFLQPTLFSGGSMTAYETTLSRNNNLVNSGIGKALAYGYKYLSGVPVYLNQNYLINSFDISDILNIKSDNEEFFLDWVHVTQKGNEIIAKKIYEKIEYQLHK